MDGEESDYNRTYIVNILDKNNNIVRSVKVENSTEWLYTKEMIDNDNIINWKVEII